MRERTNVSLLPAVTDPDRPFGLAPRSDVRALVVQVTAITLSPLRRAPAPLVIDQWPPKPRPRWPLWLAALMALVAAAIAGWFAAGSGSSTEPRSRVDVAIAPGVEIDLPELPPTARPKAAQPVKAPTPPQPVPDEQERASSQKLLTVDDLPQVQEAVRTAFANGETQSWQARGMEGYVVVGPIQIANTHVCRNIAIWSKGTGGTGQTVSSRKCMSQGGAWVDVGEPAMVTEGAEPPVPVPAATP